MINLEFFKKQIQAMDAGSKEFFDIYKMISNKYWTIENPSDYQKCAKLLVWFAERGDWEQVIAATKIIEELFSMEKNNCNTCMGTIGFKNKAYLFTITTDTDKKHLKEMEKMLGQVAKGNFTIKKKHK